MQTHTQTMDGEWIRQRVVGDGKDLEVDMGLEKDRGGVWDGRGSCKWEGQ